MICMDFTKIEMDLRDWLQVGLRRYARNIRDRWYWLIENQVAGTRSFPASTTGILSRSLQYFVDEDSFSAVVGTEVEYAQFVEQGRSPAFVPHSAIENWLLAKMKRYGWSVNNFNALVHAIVQKLETQGYPGWGHLKSVVSDESLFDLSFGGGNK